MSKISKILLLVVAFFSMFLLVACDKDDEISISVSAIKTTLVEGETTTVTATVTPAIPDGLTVELASSDEAVVTVTQAGVITAVGVGTATVTATVGEFSANVTFTVTAAVVPVTGVTLSAAKTTLEIAETTQATAVVAPENATDKTVTFTSSNASVATVSDTGLITAVAAGSTTITATAGTETATVTITVNAAVVAVTSVEITIPKEKLVVGETTQAVATVLPANATNKTVTYTSSAAAVATVSATGLVTAVAPGTAIITATAGTKTDTVVVTVFAAANDIEFALDAEVNDLVRIRGIVGAVIGRNVYLEDAEAGISIYNVPVDDLPHFAIGNEVIVDAKRAAFSGVRQLSTLTNVDVLSTGNTIRDSVEIEDLEQDTLKAQEYLRVNGEFRVVTVPSTIAVDENGLLTSHLSFRLTDGTNESVFYMHRSTSAVAVATMLDVLQAVEVGGMLSFDNVVITYFNSVAQLYVVESTTLSHVAPADPTMVVIQGDTQGDVGTTVQLTATAIPVGKPVTFTWTSSDDAVATVSANGLVTILKGGEFSISVAIVGYDITASRVMVGVVPLPDDVIIQAPAQFVVGETYQLTAIVEPEAAIQDIIWESANDEIATIDANGLLTAVAPGAVKIIAKAAADQVVYSEINIIVEAFIEPKIEIDGPSAIELGATIQLSATVFSNYAGQGVVWTSSAPTIISIDEDGLIEALLAGETVITATSVDDDTLVATLTVQVVTVTHSNILISAALAGSEDGAIEHEGYTFYVGLNAFADFKNLESALQDGSVVYVLAGTYPADRFTISASNVTILGPNAGVNPVTNMDDRVEEAVLQARVSFGAGVENTILDGLKFINSGTLFSSVPVKDLIVRNLYFIDSSADAGQGVIYFGLVGEDLVNENILITQNVLNDSRFLGYRGIRINNGKDLTITDNYFFKFYDAIRLEGSVNSGWTTPGTGAGVAGTAIIDGNIFEDSFQYSILFGRYTATHIQITNNSIDAFAEGNGSFGHINLLNPQYSDTKMVVDIMYNTFESPNNWHHVRIQRYFELTDEQIEFNVNWNKFMYESTIRPSDPPVQFAYIHKGSDAISAGNIINAANNYYAMSSLTEAAFFGVSTYEPYFLVLADFETALAAHLGIVLDDLEITSTVNEAMVDYTIQLTANKAATWSSGDETVATISEAGVVTGVSAGTVTITATYLEETVTIVITVIDRPNPTFFELVGGTSIAIGDTLQLSIDTATALPEKAYLGVLWSSSDDTVATVDQNGLVTSVTSGTVTITATSTRDAGINATHVVVVEDIVYTTEEIIIDSTLADMDKYTLVTYDSKDFYVGLNAFATLNAAEDVIEAGSTVHLLAGTYSQAFIVKASNVTFVGPNAGVNPITNMDDREAEANITARISFAEGIENVLFDGLMFTSVGQIYTNTPVKGITVQNVYFNAGTLSEAVQAFIFFGMANDEFVNEDILIQNNLFFDNKDVGRAVRLNNTKDLSILNNKFVGFFDPIRLEGTNGTGWTTPGSGVGAAGHLVIDGNRFEGSLQYPILIGRYSATHIEITNNSMNVNSGRSGVYGLINMLNAVYTDTKIVVDIQYNVFENSPNFHSVRLQRYFALTENQIEFNVNWNKFMTGPDVSSTTGAIRSYIHKGSDAISEGNIINGANNYYNIDELLPIHFFGTSTYAPYFLNEADFDYALGAHKGDVTNPVLQVTSTVDEVMYDYTIQLLTNLPVIWSSEDENIATVNAGGLVLGINVGTVKIKATYLTQEVEVEVTVTARPAPTFIEIVGATTVLASETAQLSIKLDTVLPVGASPRVVWSSENELIATVDQNGVVHPVDVGTVKIIATSVEDPLVKAEHEITIELVVFNVTQILIDASLSSMNMFDKVTVDSYDYFVGLNAFATLKAAEDVIEDGTTVYIMPGTYAEAFVVKASNVSFIGPNMGINPAEKMDDRGAEAIISGVISFATGLENILFDGFKFTGAGRIHSTVVVENFTMQNNHFHNVVADGAFGVVFFQLLEEALFSKNFLFQHNLFHDTIQTGRAIRLQNVKDFVVQHNHFDGYLDPIRIEGTNGTGFGNIGTGVGAGGNVLIDSNILENMRQYSIIITRYTADHVQITNNDITIEMAVTSFGLIYMSNAILINDHKVLDIQHNVFNNFNGSNAVRLVRYYDLTAQQFTVNVNWNVFDFVPGTTYVTSQGPTNATNSIINAANNYYAAIELLATQFVGVTTYSPNYLDMDAFLYAKAEKVEFINEDNGAWLFDNKGLNLDIHPLGLDPIVKVSGRITQDELVAAAALGLTNGGLDLDVEDAITFEVRVLAPEGTDYVIVPGLHDTKFSAWNDGEGWFVIPVSLFVENLAEEFDVMANFITTIQWFDVSEDLIYTTNVNFDFTDVEFIELDATNILIDPTLATMGKYELVEYDSKDFYVGLNAFATLQAAEDVIADGSAVHIMAGTYTDTFTVKASNVSFIGPNVGVNPVKDMDERVAEAVISGRVTFALGVEATLFDGLKFIGAGHIHSTVPVKNVTIQNVYFHNTSSAAAVEFGISDALLQNDTILIQNNVFYDTIDAGRGVRINNAKNLSIINNHFRGYWDAIRLEGINNLTTSGSGASGILIIDSNYIEEVKQYPISIGRYHATHIQVTNNHLHYVEGGTGQFGSVNIFGPVYVDTKIIVDVTHNYLATFSGNNAMRLHTYGTLTSTELEINVEWNQFMFVPGATYITKGTSTNDLINASNNYYHTNELLPSQFVGVVGNTPAFLNDDSNKIVDALDALVTEKVVARGVVTSVIKNSVFIQDENNAIFIFMGTNDMFTEKLVVGNEVIVVGKRDVNNNLKQIIELDYVFVLNAENDMPVAVDITTLLGADLLPYQSKLVDLAEVTIVSLPARPVTSTAGFNIVVSNGTDEFNLRVDSEFNLTKQARDAILVVINNLEVGQKINVNGAPLSWYWGGAQIMITDPMQITPIALTLEFIENFIEDKIATEDQVTSDIDLVTAVTVAGVQYTVDWASSNDAVISATGVVVRPAAGEPNVFVDLTATVEIDEDTTLTFVFTVEVRAIVDLSGETTYVETFDASALTASYVDGSFTGVNGVVWEYVHARNEDSFAIDGKGIMLRRASDPSSISGVITGGIAGFSFDTRKAYTGDADRALKITITNSSDVVVFEYITPVLDFGSGAQSTIIVVSRDEILIEGTVTFKIEVHGTGTTNRQIIIDNIEWISYSG